MRKQDILSLSGETQLRTIGVEDNVLALQEDVTEDGEADVRVGLNSTVAGRATVRNRSVVDVIARDNGTVATDSDGKGWEAGAAIEDIATIAVAVLSTVDLVVVGLNDIAGKQEEGSAGV